MLAIAGFTLQELVPPHRESELAGFSSVLHRLLGRPGRLPCALPLPAPAHHAACPAAYPAVFEHLALYLEREVILEAEDIEREIGEWQPPGGAAAWGAAPRGAACLLRQWAAGSATAQRCSGPGTGR